MGSRGAAIEWNGLQRWERYDVWMARKICREARDVASQSSDKAAAYRSCVLTVIMSKSLTKISDRLSITRIFVRVDVWKPYLFEIGRASCRERVCLYV